MLGAVLLVLLGLALGSVQPMVLAMLHQVTPPERHGQALGLRMLCTNAATITMPLMFGAIAHFVPVLTRSGAPRRALPSARMDR